jgi:two-component system nitrogen regulation sensor histidine kinase NtrY
MNQAAAALLEVSPVTAVGQPLAVVFDGARFGEVRRLAGELMRDPFGAPRTVPFERQLTLRRGSEEIAVLATGTRLFDEAGTPQGIVLFLEDVTHLLRVQRMEAWREVARRIAHEIKNPLTPIQLAAQRLRRRYATQLKDDGAFDDCTRTIIQQVDGLKTLVNEFATFARMPTAAHSPHNLNQLVEEATVLFREGHREIDFVFAPGEGLPVIELDREGMNRAIINLLDNAVSACRARGLQIGERHRVELCTAFDASLGIVRLEVADSGIGVPADAKARIFDPYFSTKPDGTGLGLAIVSTVVVDHQGFVRVRDNVPHGTRFVIELPVRRQATALAEQARRGAYGNA